MKQQQKVSERNAWKLPNLLTEAYPFSRKLLRDCKLERMMDLHHVSGVPFFVYMIFTFVADLCWFGPDVLYWSMQV
jgi:hypothetical protein